MFSAFLVYYFINKYSFLSRQLLQIFVHPKSSYRYLELFCPLFKLPFSYLSHPLLLSPLLFCLLFKLPFSYPFHPLLLFSLLFCLFLSSLFSYLSHPLQLFLLLFCLLFILSLTSPHNHRYCSFCYSVSFLSPLSPPPPNHRYCFLCYSVSSYSVPFSLFCRTFSSFLFLVISRLLKHIFVKC